MSTIIAAHEGQTVHNSMIDALVAQEIRRQNNEQLAAALVVLAFAALFGRINRG